MGVITFELPPVTQYQADAIFCAERNAVVEATTKAGKSLGCMLWLLRESFNAPRPGSEYWWVAPVYEQTKIAFRRYKHLLRETDPDGVLWTSNDSDPSITLANGAVLRFKSAEKPDNLYGEDVHAAVCDEVSRMREAAFHAVRSTVTATNGRIRLIGNVKGRRNWAYDLARRVQAGSLPDWKYSKITAHDAVKAGIITAAEVEAAKRELPDAVFRELYLAEPSEDGANPFGIQHIAAWLHGNGCVPVYNLMENAATAEISRSPIWQWMRSPKGVLDDGRKVTKEMFRKLLPEELARVRRELGETAWQAGRYEEAARLFDEITTSDDYVEFLTLPCYQRLTETLEAAATD